MTQSQPPSRKNATIVLLPGDGVGPEVIAEAKRVLQTVNDLRSNINGTHLVFKEELIGGAAIDQTGMYSFHVPTLLKYLSVYIWNGFFFFF